MEYTKASIVRRLYQMLYDVHQLLNQSNIKYWADQDTFLGAIHNHGLIPWASNISIGIINADKRKFLKLEPYIKDCGYSLEKINGGYQIKSKSDVMFVNLYKKSGNKYIPISTTSGGDYYLIKEINKIVNAEFGDFIVPVPSQHERYFQKKLGKNWRRGKNNYPAEPTAVRNRKCVKMCLMEGTDEKVSKYIPKVTKACSPVKGGCVKNFDIPLPTFVINCKMHTQRYKKFKTYAKKAGLVACRQPCVLGGKFSQGMICKMIEEGILASSGSIVNKVEASINMSHYNCWQRIINSCAEYGMIIEDDTEVKPDFVKHVNRILNGLKDRDIDFSIIHLWNGNWADTKLKKVTKIGRFEIMEETQQYNAGAVCYIISRNYAKFLMKKAFPIKIPQDMMMGKYVKHGRHLTLKMKFRKKDQCYMSPILAVECGGIQATGDTTQDPSAATISKINCELCKI